MASDILYRVTPVKNVLSYLPNKYFHILFS